MRPRLKRAAERGLEAHALLGDPAEHRLRFVDHVAGERLVGVAAGDAQEVVEELLLGVGPGQLLGRGIVGAAHVAGMAGVAAAVELRRRFEHQHRGAGAPRADRRTQGGVAAADDEHVVFLRQIRHLPSVSRSPERGVRLPLFTRVRPHAIAAAFSAASAGAAGAVAALVR